MSVIAAIYFPDIYKTENTNEFIFITRYRLTEIRVKILFSDNTDGIHEKIFGFGNTILYSSVMQLSTLP